MFITMANRDASGAYVGINLVIINHVLITCENCGIKGFKKRDTKVPARELKLNITANLLSKPMMSSLIASCTTERTASNVDKNIKHNTDTTKPR